MQTIPYVVERTSEGERSYDLPSRLMKERIIKIDGEITDDTAAIVTSQLLWCEYTDPDADIQIYINSPGGSVSAGLAIYDTMQTIKCDCATTCYGLAASMGSFLLAGGTKGKRTILPNAEVMIHQPLGGAQGQATEIEIAARHILKTKERLNKILSENTGQPYETVCVDTDRDNWLDAEAAVAYGIVDAIAPSRKKS